MRDTNQTEGETDLAQATIRALAEFAATYRTDFDAEDARRFGLGPSAYCYRNLNEAALVAFERAPQASGQEHAPIEKAQRRTARNRRYYLRRRERLSAS